MAYRVFISYSSKDLDVVRRVDELIVGTGVEVFFAERSIVPGESLSTRISEAIRRTDLQILVWSENCTDSDWVRDETGQARALNKLLLPVVLSGKSNLPSYLRDIKYLDASDDAESALTKLREDVLVRAEAKSESEKQGLVLLTVVVGLLLLGGK